MQIALIWGKVNKKVTSRPIIEALSLTKLLGVHAPMFP